MSTYRLIIVLLIVLTIGLSLTNIFVASSYSTGGEKLRRLEEQVSQLNLDNSRLESAMLEHSSLAKLTQTADQLGFVQPLELVSVSIPDSLVAMNQN